MSKKNGALFSGSLFGYKKADVNEYIRNSDESRAAELEESRRELFALEEELKSAQNKISELEADLLQARSETARSENTRRDEINGIKEEHMQEVAALNEKLAESESRATSYLKLADASTARAEGAEAEVSLLSAGIENANNEIAQLKAKIAEKDEQIKRNAELEAFTRDLVARQQQAHEESKKYFKIRRPVFRWIKRK